MDKFFPCFIDVDKHQHTVAFGYSNVNAHKHQLIEYAKTTKLAKLFTDDKLVDLFDEYMKDYYFIKMLLPWAKWYIYDKNGVTRPFIGGYTDEGMIEKWSKNVFTLFEKYRMSQSIFEKVLYTQLLNDHLWNPKFDPRNPRIQEYNLKRMEKISKPNVTMNESTTQEVIETSGDRDSYRLMNLQFEANFINVYNECSAKIKQLKESYDIQGIKLEAAKLQFMNAKIESVYFFSDTPISGDDHVKYSTLRNSIQNSLTECIKVISSSDGEFDMNTFYESTDLYASHPIECRQLMNYKQAIKDCF